MSKNNNRYDRCPQCHAKLTITDWSKDGAYVECSNNCGWHGIKRMRIKNKHDRRNDTIDFFN